MVVEQTAAIFFEGRVLRVDGGRLRVQTSEDTEALTVANGDVYRLVAAPRERRAGRFAICGKPSGEWFGCRVEQPHGRELRVLDSDGRHSTLSEERVLAATPVTELNLKRYFERARERANFMRAAARAGQPKPPPGWKPALRERVLGHYSSGWYSAKIETLDEDRAALRSEFDRQGSELTLSDVVPEPPYPEPLRRGDFVLVRPKIASLPWTVRKVAGVDPGNVQVIDMNSNRQTIPLRDVVPLGG